MNKSITIGIVFILACYLTMDISLAAQNKEGRLRDAIVKIHTVSSDPDYFSPWKLSDHESSSGSGAIIKGNRILTNAHVVSNQKYIQVQPYGSPDRYDAKVLYVSHEADLAILTVEDRKMFQGRHYLEIGSLPETLQEVLVYGYPTGGDSLSITKGILSRVVYDSYVHSGNYFMAGQVDAAINHGNSGGPVIVGNKIVGVVMQGLSGHNVENIGYMIPPPVINHFLLDVKDGRYDGFPDTGFYSQAMENPGMREKYKMKEGQTGLLVTHVVWNAGARGVVEKGDVILSIEGHDIANDETIEFRENERISYAYYSDMHQLGDELNLGILRDGVPGNIKYRLGQAVKDLLLVPLKQYDSLPSYFIFGGLVFSPLTENLLCVWEGCAGPANLASENNKYPSEKRQQVVLALQVLPAEINRGYHGTHTLVIDKVNGQGFKDFKEFYSLVSTSHDPFVVFENEKGAQLVIDRKKAEKSHQSILETYNVKADRSPDLQ